MPGHSRQCRALAALLQLALPLLPQKAGHHLAHLPHQAARRTPGHLLPGLWWAASVVASLGVSLVRPSAATLAGRLAALLAASAAAISAALPGLPLAAALVLLRVLRWVLPRPQLQPLLLRLLPGPGLVLRLVPLAVPLQGRQRAQVPGRLAARLLAQRLVRWFQASERLLALASASLRLFSSRRLSCLFISKTMQLNLPNLQ